MRGSFVYLHGFASGPGSTKACFFRDRLAEIGCHLDIPDLAPDFAHVTVSGMLGVAAPLVREPGVLFGSSLGGYLATLLAVRNPGRVRGLVLMAPAFGFVRGWEARMGPDGLAKWRARGTMPVFHYGRNRHEPLAMDLLDDARQFPEEPDPTCPTLVLAGRHDDLVPVASAERFAARRPERTLVVFDSGHELTDVLPALWDRTLAFLRTLPLP